MWCRLIFRRTNELVLEGEHVAGRLLALGSLVDPLLPADQSLLLERF